jgi:UDP-N-acetyl-D-mannosaminuronate dehydrogenase
MVKQVDFLIAIPTPAIKAKDPHMQPVKSASNIVEQIFYAAPSLTSYRNYFF